MSTKVVFPEPERDLWQLLLNPDELAALAYAAESLLQQLAHGANCAQGSTEHLRVEAERIPTGVHLSIGLR